MRYNDLPPGVSIFDEHINPLNNILDLRSTSTDTRRDPVIDAAYEEATNAR